MAAIPGLLILSSESDRLLSIDASGAVQAVAGLEDLAVADVAAGAAGELIIATRGLPGSLVRFDLATRAPHSIAVAQGGDEGLAALARWKDGTLCCSEYRHGRASVVAAYAADGKFLGPKAELSGFCGFALSSSGEIVTPTFRASPAGVTLWRYGAAWAEEEPRGIAVSEEGLVAIALPESKCVVLTDLDGREKARLVHPDLKLPRGVCFHGTALWVTCLKSNRVLRFEPGTGAGAVIHKNPALGGPGRLIIA
jgi:hypothetical protein